MQYWLVKSEPDVYSWEDFVKEKKTDWTGVRNYGARNNLRTMKKGDKVLFYHSNKGMEIVGIAIVTKESFQDPTTDDANWVAVQLKPDKALQVPLKLADIKAVDALKNMALIRLGRLSVQPVTADEWNIIHKMTNGD